MCPATDRHRTVASASNARRPASCFRFCPWARRSRSHLSRLHSAVPSEWRALSSAKLRTSPIARAALRGPSPRHRLHPRLHRMAQRPHQLPMGWWHRLRARHCLRPRPWKFRPCRKRLLSRILRLCPKVLLRLRPALCRRHSLLLRLPRRVLKNPPRARIRKRGRDNRAHLPVREILPTRHLRSSRSPRHARRPMRRGTRQSKYPRAVRAARCKCR